MSWCIWSIPLCKYAAHQLAEIDQDGKNLGQTGLNLYMDSFEFIGMIGARKKDKKDLTFRNGNLNLWFWVIFPPIIWIFMWTEELLKEIGLDTSGCMKIKISFFKYRILFRCQMNSNSPNHPFQLAFGFML